LYVRLRVLGLGFWPAGYLNSTPDFQYVDWPPRKRDPAKFESWYTLRRLCSQCVMILCKGEKASSRWFLAEGRSQYMFATRDDGIMDVWMPSDIWFLSIPVLSQPWAATSSARVIALPLRVTCRIHWWQHGVSPQSKSRAGPLSLPFLVKPVPWFIQRLAATSANTYDM
jgi:hypothetical protein